jgi:hypothetical protein
MAITPEELAEELSELLGGLVLPENGAVCEPYTTVSPGSFRMGLDGEDEEFYITVTRAEYRG